MFGTVKLVHDVTQKDLIAAKPLAVKYVKKGYTFRDNVLYTPMKKEALITEVEILRVLNGECFTLQLMAVYESPSMIYMITECCEGGEMMPWVSMAFANQQQQSPLLGNGGSGGAGLRTEDVSRIAYQLWSAVQHCAKHKVIHRDIKPENVMFCTKDRDSPVRLIDFGSGTIDGGNTSNNTAAPSNSNSESEDVERHHTFAGSAFYISPEMFQRTYTHKTDVWSVAVTLYVLVAGYPAEQLQEAFNILHSASSSNKAGVGRVRTLPNMPTNIPESFHDMLEGALVYRHKARMDAGQLMQCEFAQFHMHHHEEQQQHKQQQKQRPGIISITEVANEAAGGGGDDDGGGMAEDHLPEMANSSKSGSRKTQSVLLEGSVSRHNTYLGYQKFERSVTTILATMLSKETCTKLLLLLRGQQQSQEGTISGNISANLAADGNNGNFNTIEGSTTSPRKLQVVTLEVLLEVLGSMQVENTAEVEEV